MKTIKIIFPLMTLALMLVLGCTKEPPSIDGFSATVEDTDVDAGQLVKFTINKGDAEFITFFSGRTGSVYANYPTDKGQQLDLQYSNLYTTTYNNQGVYTATVLAISYGNWSEDSKEKVVNFTINVTDNRTGFTSYKVKLSLTKELKGSINTDAHTIRITFPAGSTLTQRSTLYTTESPNAKVYLADDTEISSGDKLDYTAEFTLKVVAPGGAEQVWTVIPVLAP
jgi:hypothetical protein